MKFGLEMDRGGVCHACPLMDRLRYKSLYEHDRTFDNWNSWFKDGLFSRYYTKLASKTGAMDTNQRLVPLQRRPVDQLSCALLRLRLPVSPGSKATA